MKIFCVQINVRKKSILNLNKIHQSIFQKKFRLCHTFIHFHALIMVYLECCTKLALFSLPVRINPLSLFWHIRPFITLGKTNPLALVLDFILHTQRPLLSHHGMRYCDVFWPVLISCFMLFLTC